jgi:hypothetical protein
MIRLSDDELDARPLAPDRRDAFLQEVAAGLSRYPEIGPGVVHQVAVQVQRQFFPPQFRSGPISKQCRQARDRV